MTTTPNEDQVANVRYLVDDVAAAIDFYTAHLGFTVHTNAVPAFADVIRGPLRLLLSGPSELRRPSHTRRFHERRPQPHPSHRH